MRVEVNGVRLYFDVEGAKLVPDGPVMQERPTLILLHGGPGQDHTAFKPLFSRFADIAQVIYLDHRGNGRSDRQPQSAWNLAQWGDDVFEFAACSRSSSQSSGDSRSVASWRSRTRSGIQSIPAS